jgi:hypothetical protein
MNRHQIWNKILRKAKHLNHVALAKSNLFSLSHLFTRRTNNRELLVNYFQSHVVISNQYMNIMQQEVIQKDATKIIK